MSNSGAGKYESCNVDDLKKGVEAIKALESASNILANANTSANTPPVESSDPFAAEMQFVNPATEIRKALDILKKAVSDLDNIMRKNEDDHKVCEEFKQMIEALEKEISGQTPLLDYLPIAINQVINFREKILAEQANINQAISQKSEAAAKNTLGGLTGSSSPLFPEDDQVLQPTTKPRSTTPQNLFDDEGERENEVKAAAEIKSQLAAIESEINSAVYLTTDEKNQLMSDVANANVRKQRFVDKAEIESDQKLLASTKSNMKKIEIAETVATSAIRSNIEALKQQILKSPDINKETKDKYIIQLNNPVFKMGTAAIVPAEIRNGALNNYLDVLDGFRNDELNKKQQRSRAEQSNAQEEFRNKQENAVKSIEKDVRGLVGANFKDAIAPGQRRDVEAVIEDVAGKPHVTIVVKNTPENKQQLESIINGLSSLNVDSKTGKVDPKLGNVNVFTKPRGLTGSETVISVPLEKFAEVQAELNILKTEKQSTEVDSNRANLLNDLAESGLVKGAGMSAEGVKGVYEMSIEFDPDMTPEQKNAFVQKLRSGADVNVMKVDGKLTTIPQDVSGLTKMTFPVNSTQINMFRDQIPNMVTTRDANDNAAKLLIRSGLKEDLTTLAGGDSKLTSNEGNFTLTINFDSNAKESQQSILDLLDSSDISLRNCDVTNNKITIKNLTPADLQRVMQNANEIVGPRMQVAKPVFSKPEFIPVAPTKSESSGLEAKKESTTTKSNALKKDADAVAIAGQAATKVNADLKEVVPPSRMARFGNAMRGFGTGVMGALRTATGIAVLSPPPPKVKPPPPKEPPPQSALTPKGIRMSESGMQPVQPPVAPVKAPEPKADYASKAELDQDKALIAKFGKSGTSGNLAQQQFAVIDVIKQLNILTPEEKSIYRSKAAEQKDPQALVNMVAELEKKMERTPTFKASGAAPNQPTTSQPKTPPAPASRDMGKSPTGTASTKNVGRIVDFDPVNLPPKKGSEPVPQPISQQPSQQPKQQEQSQPDRLAATLAKLNDIAAGTDNIEENDVDVVNNNSPVPIDLLHKHKDHTIAADRTQDKKQTTDQVQSTQPAPIPKNPKQ